MSTSLAIKADVVILINKSYMVEEVVGCMAWAEKLPP